MQPVLYRRASYCIPGLDDPNRVGEEQSEDSRLSRSHHGGARSQLLALLLSLVPGLGHVVAETERRAVRVVGVVGKDNVIVEVVGKDEMATTLAQSTLMSKFASSLE